MGDDLLSLPSVYDQVIYTQQEFSLLIGGDSQVLICLIEEYKPLPHKGHVSTASIVFINSSDCVGQPTTKNESENKTITVPLKTPEELIGNLQIVLKPDFQPPKDFEQFLISAGGYFARLFELSRLSVWMTLDSGSK